MNRTAIRLTSLTVFVGAQLASPVMPVLAAGGGDPGAPDIMHPSSTSAQPSQPRQPRTNSPTTGSTHRSKKAAKQSFLDDPAFIQGYHTAYTSIYDRHDY